MLYKTGGKKKKKSNGEQKTQRYRAKYEKNLGQIKDKT